MKFYLSVFLTIFSFGVLFSQSNPSGQNATVSADTGISISTDGDISKKFIITVADYGWELTQIPEVISYFKNRSSVIDVDLSSDNLALELRLLNVQGKTDKWNNQDWNNHLNTIK